MGDFANLLGVTWSYDPGAKQLTFAGKPVTYDFAPGPHTHDEHLYAPVRVLSDLADIAELIKSKQIVDLTHSFGPGIPHWYGFGDETPKTLYTVEKEGFWVTEYTHVGQWGTHVDPPAHFHAGLRTVDQIPTSEMVLPMVVLDVHEQVAKNPDYTVTWPT